MEGRGGGEAQGVADPKKRRYVYLKRFLNYSTSELNCSVQECSHKSLLISLTRVCSYVPLRPRSTYHKDLIFSSPPKLELFVIKLLVLKSFNNI
jgi:hypothetical protein